MAGKHISYNANDRMRELLADNNLLLMTISRFDLPFGFGDRTIGDICRAGSVDTDTFLAVCNLLSGRPCREFEISLPDLIAYLKRAHASFVGFYLPKIRHKLLEAINYTDTDDVSFQLVRFFDGYVQEVTRHMDYENDTIFAYADHLLQGTIDDGFSISRFSVNHSHMATKLKELKDLFIYHYKQRDNTRLSSVLFDLVICERDLMNHFDVENKLFVPAVERLEESLRRNYAADEDGEETDGSDRESQLDALSEREREIIRCVAHGMANKEIAESLCLSVHTVATHRRNLSAKLGIHSTAGLTIFAILHHLVDLEEVSPQQD